MIRKGLIAAIAACAFAAGGAQAQTEIQWWHSMGGALGDKVNDLASKFNASQKDYKVVPSFKNRSSNPTHQPTSNGGGSKSARTPR